jgi:hypothetical protein
MTRTVDSPVCGLEPGDIVNMCGSVAPNDLVQKPVESLRTDAEIWQNCRVQGTYMDGSFIEPRAGFNSSDSYHSPPDQTIVKSGRYVILRVLNSGIDIPIREPRFEALIDHGTLHPVQD